MIDPSVSSDRLAAISTDTWFVLGAYFFAFFPWVVLSNTDYITEKWRTIRRTRGHARYHMAFSIVPMMYVSVYAEAQRRAGDSKELGAALAALFLNLIHFVRTVWGLAQLNAFVAWCKEALECLRAMKGVDEDGEIPLEEKLMVNNTVVDNELGGTDVAVKFSWRKVWAGVKRWEFKPSTWLVTEYPGLCTARWTATFLCGTANLWCGYALVGWSEAGEALTSFYSGAMGSALGCLRDVTCSVEESGKSTFASIRENELAISRGAAYGSDELSRCYTYVSGGYKSYNFEIDSLRSSYPVRNVKSFGANNRDVAVAGLADSVELAKHLGLEKLSAMRRYFDRYKLPTDEIWRKAWYLLLEQVDRTPPDNSPLRSMFLHLDRIPFPYQLQMVALWDECTNWRVLQASAHADISSSLFSLRIRGNRNLVETGNVFEHCRREASSRFIVGVSMESVRTFLGEWVMSAPDVVDWEPQISGEEFEFSVSSYSIERFHDIGGSERMVWECQRALQSKISKTSPSHRNFASNAELMMLYILSMPGLRVKEEKERREYVRGNEVSGVRGTGNSLSRLGRAHSTVDVSVRVWRAWSWVEPQDVSVIIRIDMESERASLRLQCGARDTRFKWEDWVNTAMGIMKAYDKAKAKKQGRKGETKRLLRKVDLGEPVVELCPLYRDKYSGLLVQTGTVGIWMGWRVFDARICKFEMDQWLRACNINYKYRKEVSRAEEVIWQVVTGGPHFKPTLTAWS